MFYECFYWSTPLKAVRAAQFYLMEVIQNVNLRG